MQFEVRMTKTCSTMLVSTLLAAAASWPAVAGTGSSFPAWSPDIHLGHGQLLVRDEEAAIDVGSLSLAFLGGLPEAADLDALHGLSNGDLLFSTDISLELGGTFFRACDVIRFDGVNWSKEFDCSAQGVPAGADVDAVAMSGNDLLISLDITAELGGQVFDDADVIAFDGADFSMFLDASAAGVGASADVDALHLDEMGRVLVSFDTSGELGGITFSDEDVMAWDDPGWSLEFDGGSDDPAWASADLDAWSYAFLGDLLFRQGFE